MNNKIKTKDQCEFIGQIIDLFEDFLEMQGFGKFFEKDNIKMMLAAGCSVEEALENNVVLYGDNYSWIADRLRNLMDAWGIFEDEEDRLLNVQEMALAIRPEDLNEAVLSAVKPEPEIIEEETPDAVYKILRWDNVDIYESEIEALKDAVSDVRHSFVLGTAEGIDLESKSYDKDGCDGEFDEIIKLGTAVLLWGEKPLFEHKTLEDIVEEATDDEIIDMIPYKTRDRIYRVQLMWHTAKDIVARADYNGIHLYSDEVNNAASRYAFDGEYDCNLDYWSNMDVLIDYELESREKPSTEELLKLYNSHKANCCNCGCELSDETGFGLGSIFILDKRGDFYCTNCDHIFSDSEGDERIFDADLAEDNDIKQGGEQNA